GSFNGRRNDSVTTDFAIPGDAGLGDYTISGLQLSDGATNKVHYDAAALAGMGFDPTVHVVGTPDTQPPQLTALRVDPATVDTSRGEHAVDVTASATDDRRGVKSITVSVGDASGNLWSSDGTPESGDWENRINLAQFSGPSELPISVKLIDREGNERDYTSEQLAAAGLPSVVHETGPADTTPPTLTGFELSPTHVDTASQDQLVQVVVDGSDVISGSNLAWIYLRFPTGDTESFGAGFNDNGDSNDSLAHPSFDLPQGSPLGEYEIYRVELTDRAGNTAVFDNSNGLDGYPVTFQNGP
ncbi:MAG: hypothetical protein QOJ01_993, partial [Solirubrobacterales bacterium]|nr:hypothetical protein [Solirubrobacterales bacterium]